MPLFNNVCGLLCIHFYSNSEQQTAEHYQVTHVSLNIARKTMADSTAIRGSESHTRYKNEGKNIM